MTEDDTQLEDRVEQLEETIKKMLPSRREALGMGVAGLAGASLMSGTASAGSSQVGTIGSASQRADLFAEDVDISDTLTVGGQTTFNGPVAGVEGIPAGGIIMWSGSIANIPSGFALCDGTNGTPDLTDRFVVGAGGSESVGATGGTDNQSVNVSISGTTDDAAFQGPDQSTGDVLNNNSFPSKLYQRAFNGPESEFITQYNVNGEVARFTGSGFNFGTANIKPLRADFSASGSDSFDNRPSYYALAYIMKL